MDLIKAFDTVPRHLLFAKLEAIVVEGRILNVIKDLYTGNSARIRVGEYTTESFNIESGVMQGSKLGPILFIIYINDLLKQLQDSKLGIHIWSIVISALGFADDIILLADNPSNLQRLIDICAELSRTNGMSFNTDKCKVMVLNGKRKNLRFTLHGLQLEIVQKYKYLGLLLTNTRLTSLITKHVEHVIGKAEKRVNCIRHYGFQSDGLRPQTSIEMYKILVRPILEYAAQVLNYQHNYFKKAETANISEPIPNMVTRFETFQNKVLKKLIPCPKSTPPALLRILTGTVPFSCRVDMLKLRYFWDCLHTENSKLSKVICCKRDTSSKIGYCHSIFNLCCKYNCLNVWLGILKSRNSKINPSNEIRRIVEASCFKLDLKKALESQCLYTTLFIYPHIPKYTGYKIENFLKQIGTFPDAEGRKLFLYALLDTCKHEISCPRCSLPNKDIVGHILSSCTKACQLRLNFRLQLMFYGVPSSFQFTNKEAIFSLIFGRKVCLKLICSFLKDIGYLT